MRLFSAAALGAAALISLLIAGPSRAHEGHDHAPTPPAAPASAQARGEAASESFELVAIGAGERLTFYLDRFSTNEPVTDARLEVETPTGPVVATPSADGTYTIAAPWLKQAGKADFIVTITAADGTSDILPITITVPERMGAVSPTQGNGSWRGPLVEGGGSALLGLLIGVAVIRARWRKAVAAFVWAIMVLSVAPTLAHEGHDHGAPQTAVAPTGASAQRLPDGNVFVPKTAQRIFGVRTFVTQSATHQGSKELPGRIIPDPNASGFVQSAIGGRLSPPPDGFPRLGARVKAGDVLAYVTPPIQAIDVSDMRQRQGELDQQIAIAERRLARSETLAPSGTVARSTLEDARSEVEGLKQRRAMLDRSRREPEALIAPVSGIVADGSAVAGQMAQPNAVVFHIIDPSSLWIEALSFEVVSEPQEAVAKLASGKTYKLSYRGAGFADRNQSIPVHFALEGDLAGLRAGQFVSVLVRTDEQRIGIALPSSALVRAANGQDIVYEHISAESFAPRLVRTEPLDGEHVLITAGLEPGKRVVTQAAELIDHVR